MIKLTKTQQRRCEVIGRLFTARLEFARFGITLPFLVPPKGRHKILYPTLEMQIAG